MTREAKAVTKANRSWFLRHKVLTGIGTVAAVAVVCEHRGRRQARDDQTGSRPRTLPRLPSSVEQERRRSPLVEEAPVKEARPAHRWRLHRRHRHRRRSVPRERRGPVLRLCTREPEERRRTSSDIRRRPTARSSSPSRTSRAPSPRSTAARRIVLTSPGRRDRTRRSLGNGDWLVGTELTAGRYSAAVDTDATDRAGDGLPVERQRRPGRSPPVTPATSCSPSRTSPAPSSPSPVSRTPKVG